jgi:hypothetical protein
MVRKGERVNRQLNLQLAVASNDHASFSSSSRTCIRKRLTSARNSATSSLRQ